MDLHTHLPTVRPTTRAERKRIVAEGQDRLRTMIERTVADVFDIECEKLRLATRGQAPVALARQAAMYVAHVACGLRLSEVGRMFSRDRTTVAHACALIEQRRDDDGFCRAIELVELVVSVLEVVRARRPD